MTPRQHAGRIFVTANHDVRYQSAVARMIDAKKRGLNTSMLTPFLVAVDQARAAVIADELARIPYNERLEVARILDTFEVPEKELNHGTADDDVRSSDGDTELHDVRLVFSGDERGDS